MKLALGFRRSMSRILGNYPRLYYPVMRYHPRYSELLITDSTEIVIEGYPRSGNTFAVAALQFAQPRPIHIARHTHSPAQVIQAVRRGLPTLVLVRAPRDAAISLLIRESGGSLECALQRYLEYYTRIHRHRDGFVVGAFDEVVGNFGAVIDRLNRAFGLGLTPFDHTLANRDAVFRIVEDMERRNVGVLRENSVARPSSSRREPKGRLAEALAHPRYQSLLGECEALYRTYKALSRRTGRREAFGCPGG
jgi:hypothetical protein